MFDLALTTTTQQIATQPTTTQPTMSSTNKISTGIQLNSGCGTHSNSGVCITDHSTCSPTKSDPVWKCRCVHGYVRKDTDCVQVPDSFFISPNVHITIARTTNKGSTILDIKLSNNVTALCKGPPSIRLDRSGPFSALASDCEKIRISLTGDIPVLNNEINFMLLATLKLDDDILVKDGILMTIKISDITIPVNMVVAIPDGTFAGTTIATVDQNYIFPTDELSLSDTSLFSIDSIGRISVKTNIELSVLRSKITLYHAVPLIINKKVQGQSSSNKFVELTVIIVRSMFSSDIPENSTNGYTIATVGDLTGLNFTISSEGMPVDTFDLSQSVVSVRNNALLDYENGKRKYEFNIKNIVNLPDNGHMSLITRVVLNILDRNDHAPTFSKQSYVFEIDHSSLDKVLVGLARADDLDSNTVLKYSLEGVQDNFLVDGFGIITTAKRPENIPFADVKGNGLYSGNYSFQIRVSDSFFLPQYADVTVYLLQSPQLELNKKFQFSVLESSSVGSIVGVITVAGYRGYQFASPDRAGKYFSIDHSTGTVRLAGKLDREGDPGEVISFSVVGVQDAKSFCYVTILGDLIVNVIDVNDNPPEYKERVYTGTIIEGKENEIVTLDNPITTTDKDQNGTVTFSLSNSFSKFAINSKTAVIITTAKLDRESNNNFNLKVVAFDGVFSATTTIAISVRDINDNSPVFSAASSAFSAKEPENDGNPIGTVSATDQDLGQNAEITYTLEGGDGLFSIDHKSGQISLTGQLDRESKINHTITVTAIDGGVPYTTSIHSVLVTVTDINDNSPVLPEDSLSHDVLENINCSSTSIMTVLANDPDDGENGRVSFKILTENDRFSITDDGKVYCKFGLLDYETEKTYSFEVLAEDNAVTNRRNVTATVYINVQDVNDNAPLIQTVSDVVLKRSEFSGKPLFLVEATDEDSGNNAKLFYNITSSLPLEIDGSGVVKGTAEPNKGTYGVTVKVKDGGSPTKETSTSFNIQVTDDQADGVKFTTGEINLEINENNAANALVGGVSSLVNNPLNVKYQFIQAYSYFDIDVDSGNIKAKVVLDREDVPEHQLVVKAYNPNDANDNDLTIVKVKVKDINDNKPTFIGHFGVYILSVRERETIGFVIKTVVATDADEGENAKIKYSVQYSSDCSRNYNIDEDSGTISLKNQQDYEILRRCTFSIQATDSKFTITREVDVNILDDNDNSPIFYDIKPLQVKEDAKISEKLQIPGYVTDKDSNANGDIMFSIDDTSGCPFKVERQIYDKLQYGIMFSPKQELDYETTKQYTCVITAKDKGNPVLNATQQISVQVLDVNDNDPIIDHSSIGDPIDVSRDVNVGFVVISNISASDADSGINKKITYHLADSQYFLIHPDTGKITVRERLVGLQKDSVTIAVTARDSGTPPRQSSKTIRINIKDDNIRPQFEVSTVTINIYEERTITDVIYTVAAVDFQYGTRVKCNCTYRFTKPSNVFEIDSSTGIIKMQQNKFLNREGSDGPEVILSVIGRDSDVSNPKDSDPFTLKIIVNDINDQAPLFRQDISSVMLAIPQTAPLNTLVGTITAVDRDVGQNAITKYHLVDVLYSPSGLASDTNSSVFSSHVLTINESSGEITTNGSLNLGKTKDFYLVVRASATDAMESTHVDYASFAVRVLYDDPNKYSPVFSQDIYRVSIDRKHKVSDKVVSVSAADNDASPPNNKLVYSIIGGNVRDLFTIDGDTSIITIRYTIDGSIEASLITLTVEAKDMGVNARKSTCLVEITLIGDLNKFITQSEADAQKQLIETDRDIFMIVMILFIVLMCFFIILSIVFIYKYKVAQSKLPKKLKNRSDVYSGLDEDSKSKSVSSIYTVPSTTDISVPGAQDIPTHEYEELCRSLKPSNMSNITDDKPPQLPKRSSEQETQFTNLNEGL